MWQSYDPYTDTYCTSANTETYGPHCGGWGTDGLADPANHVDTGAHVRGFKGKGPAYTEEDDNYVCTIHSRECKEINGALKDAENDARTRAPGRRRSGDNTSAQARRRRKKRQCILSSGQTRRRRLHLTRLR